VLSRKKGHKENKGVESGRGRESRQEGFRREKTGPAGLMTREETRARNRGGGGKGGPEGGGGKRWWALGKRGEKWIRYLIYSGERKQG